MRLAFFDNLPDGGAKRVLLEEIKGLSAKHTVFPFTQAKHQPLVVNFRPLDDFLKIIFSYGYQYWLAFRINRLKCDVCIVHADQFTQAPFILRFLKIKTIYLCQEPFRLIYDPANRIPDHWPRLNRWYEKLYRRVLKQIDLTSLRRAGIIIANSFFSQGQISKAYGLPSHVVYPGVDNTIFKPLNLPKKPYVLFIGGRNKIDGWDRLQKIRPYFTQRGIHIKDTYFQNHLTDAAMARLYNQAICLLALDRREPFGLKVLEALACGTDVIAVSDGGYREIARLYHRYGLDYFSWQKHNEGLINYC